MKELIIIQKEREKQIAYVEQGVLKEYYKEEEGKKRLEGNIYIGKVVDVLPGMQAGFVDIGEEKNTFLHIRDVLPKKSKLTGNKEENLEEYKIKDYIKPNDMLLVQVKKDSNQMKGARVSTHLQVTGRFVVILPENDFVTISQKIEDETERNRLLSIVKEIKKERKIGVIVRTAGEGKKKEMLEQDMEHTIKKLEQWQRQFEEQKEKKKPSILQKSDTILEKILLDMVDQKLDNIWVNSKEVQETIEGILKEWQQEVTVKIQYEKQGLENRYDLESQIEKMEHRKIWLTCGGFITIDKTEALTAIDVNSRKIYRKRKVRKNSSKSK